MQQTKKGAVQATPPVLLAVPDAARALGIGRTELFLMIRRGDIRSVKIGRRRLVPVEELRRFVEREMAKDQ